MMIPHHDKDITEVNPLQSAYPGVWWQIHPEIRDSLNSHLYKYLSETEKIIKDWHLKYSTNKHSHMPETLKPVICSYLYDRQLLNQPRLPILADIAVRWSSGWDYYPNPEERIAALKEILKGRPSLDDGIVCYDRFGLSVDPRYETIYKNYEINHFSDKELTFVENLSKQKDLIGDSLIYDFLNEGSKEIESEFISLYKHVSEEIQSEIDDIEVSFHPGWSQIWSCIVIASKNVPELIDPVIKDEIGEINKFYLVFKMSHMHRVATFCGESGQIAFNYSDGLPDDIVNKCMPLLLQNASGNSDGVYRIPPGNWNSIIEKAITIIRKNDICFLPKAHLLSKIPGFDSREEFKEWDDGNDVLSLLFPLHPFDK